MDAARAKAATCKKDKVNVVKGTEDSGKDKNGKKS